MHSSTAHNFDDVVVSVTISWPVFRCRLVRRHGAPPATTSLHVLPSSMTNTSLNTCYIHFPKYFFIYHDDFEACQIIRNLKNSTSIATDEINHNVLKYVSVLNVIFLSSIYILNIFIRRGELKITATKPVHKKGDKNNLGNRTP